MDYRVMFINPVIVQRDGQHIVDGPTYVGAMARASLRSHGIDCVLPVDSLIRCESTAAALGEMMARVMRCCRPDCLNVIGVTNWASTALTAMVLMHHIREQCEELRIPVLIVAGGPFFVRESGLGHAGVIPDSIEATLSWEPEDGRRCPYDGVVYGGFTALIELIGAVQAGEVKPQAGRLVPREAPEGYYHRNGAEIRGRGRSAATAVAVPPAFIAERRHGYDATLMFSTRCPNGCDYCSIGERHRFQASEIGRAVQELKVGSLEATSPHVRERFGYLKLLDPNPFADSNARHSAACFEEIRSGLGFAPKVHCYYDTHAFTKPDRLLEELERFNIRRVFVGREAIGEPGLSFIGRRFGGRLRTETMIEEEKAGLEAVIRKRRESGEELRLAISYILSPVETPESLRSILSDMEGFIALSGGCVRVHVQWEMLWPNPGTRVLKKYRALVTDDVYFAMSAGEVWRPEAIAAKYPTAVFGRSGSAVWDRVSLDAAGLQELVAAVA
jgi:hypothetical protein